MKLTFAIPAYNEETTISKCLESVFEELKGKNYDTEIIVVNNASTDRTKEIALSFPGVKVVDQPRKGLTWARQAGFTAASGDIIANIDADTVLPKGWIDKVFLEFSKNDKLVALSGPHIYRDISKMKQLGVKIFYCLGYMTYLFNYYLIKKGCMLQGGNFIVKKSALEKIGGYSLDFDFYEDTDIASRIYKVGHVKYTFALPIYASARRFKKEGLVFAGLKYAINYFWVLIFKKPLSKGYVDIRSEQ
jgi:glycosyltransferase involved in cell wall biosynthesis